MEQTKRQVLPVGLWIVATPIGNLGDLTPRAKTALETAGLILCEDTRRTVKLMSALNIMDGMKRLRRMDAHTEKAQIDHWVEQLEGGLSIALVTDAGTPAVSDPGAALVIAASAAGIRVTPVPGVSAVTTLLSVCGFQEAQFTFRGFFPRTNRDQQEELEQVLSPDAPAIHLWFESPQRIENSLRTLSEFSPNAQVVAGKELTKIHERIFKGISQEVLQSVSEEIAAEGALGEWVFAVRFEKEKKSKIENTEWTKALECLREAGVSASRAAQIVSQQFGIPRNEIYKSALILFEKNSKKDVDPS